MTEDATKPMAGTPVNTVCSNQIVWTTGEYSGTSLTDFVDDVWNVDAAIAKIEKASGLQGEWDQNDFGGWDWWGLNGFYDGKLFSIYTHKSGTLKIGSYQDGLDVKGLKAALLDIIKEGA